MANYEPKTLSNRQRLGLRYISIGRTTEQAGKEVGLSATRVSQIASSSLGQKYLTSLEGELDAQFKHLYSKVIKVVEDALSCSDASIALAGANIWLKSHGKFVHKVETRNLTAEDIIARIMSGELQRPATGPISKQLEGAQTFEEAEFHPVAEAKGLN